jgi:hypothetical protein
VRDRFQSQIRPADGDIAIARDQSSGRKVSFTLGVVPGPPQIRCCSYEQALIAARGSTKQRPAAIWFTEDGRTFRPVVVADQARAAAAGASRPKG